MNLNELYHDELHKNVTHDLYIWGRYNPTKYTYGSGIVHVIRGEICHTKSLSGNDLDLSTLESLGGELRAAIVSILYAVKMGINNIRIHYWYPGIEHWATGKWKRNNKFAKGYYEFVQKTLDENPELRIHFVRIQEHSDDPFSESAIELAKKACE